MKNIAIDDKLHWRLKMASAQYGIGLKTIVTSYLNEACNTYGIPLEPVNIIAPALSAGEQ